MKNPTGNKLEELVFGMFDQMVEGADKYVTKQESTWLIFTEDRRWVIEFTRDKTLWFNYNIFQSELELIGKDCTEERDLIKNWFESRFLNKPKVKEAHHVDVMKFFDKKMENTIENGVKNTFMHEFEVESLVEDTIENGVKDTRSYSDRDKKTVGDIIQSGVKETYESKSTKSISLRHAIKNGVKHIEDGDWLDQDERIGDIIENGVKEIREVTFLNQMFVEETIQDGVKEIQPLPAQDGNRDWGLYYHRQEDRTKPHTEYVKEVIEDSYNHMGRIEGVIRNTDKDGI